MLTQTLNKLTYLSKACPRECLTKQMCQLCLAVGIALQKHWLRTLYNMLWAVYNESNHSGRQPTITWIVFSILLLYNTESASHYGL